MSQGNDLRTSCFTFLNDPNNQLECPAPPGVEYACTAEFCEPLRSVQQDAARNCSAFVDAVNNSTDGGCQKFSCVQMIKASCESGDFQQAQRDASDLVCYCPVAPPSFSNNF